MEEKTINLFVKRVDDSTPNGGSYSIGYYYDGQDNPGLYNLQQ